MIITELIGELIGRALAEGVFYGFLKLIQNTYYILRKLIFGIEKPINPKKEFEKQFLYKEIELTENLNSILLTGQRGVILEVINRNRVLAEFYDRNGNQIEWRHKKVFKIGMKQFNIKK
jgi:hypothetical protein